METNFRRIAPKLLKRYFRRERRAAKPRAAIAELHRFRIRTKRIRYVYELYEKLFPAEMKRAVRELQNIQDSLGAVQDQSMVVAYFERRLAAVRKAGRQAEYLRVLHRARARQSACREEFLRRWKRLEHSGFEKKLPRSIR